MRHAFNHPPPLSSPVKGEEILGFPNGHLFIACCEETVYRFSKIRNVKMLLVEDDELIRESLSLVFMNNGCNLTACETAEEGLQALEKEYFDIIISDFRLPGMNGLEFLESTAASYPQAAKILMSAYAENHVISAALNRGVHAFLEKPFSIKTLVRTLVLLAEQSQWQRKIHAQRSLENHLQARHLGRVFPC